MKNIMENITEEQSSLIKKMSGLGYTYVYDKDISEEGFLAWKEDGSTVAFGIDGWEAVDDLIQHADKLCETYSLKELQDRADGNYNVIEYGDYRDSEVRGAIYKLEHEKSFSQQVDEVLNGTVKRYNNLKVCNTPQILLDIGCEQLPMLYSQRHLQEALKPKNKHTHSHGLTVDLIKKIPDLISSPVMVYDSLSKKDSIIVVTSEFDTDNLPIIISVRPNGKGMYELENVDSNFITSIYGRNNFENHFKQIIQQNNLLFCDKQKSQKLFSLLGLQSPKGFNSIGFNVIIHQSNNISNNKLAVSPQISKISQNAAFSDNMLLDVTEAAATREAPEASPKQTVDSALDAFKKELADCGFQCTPGLADNYRELIHSGMNMTLEELSDAYRAGNSTINEKIMELVKNEDFASIEEFKEEIANDRKAVADYLKWRSEAGHFKNEGITREYVEACKSLLADYYINAIGEELAEQELMQQPPDPDMEIQE